MTRQDVLVFGQDCGECGRLVPGVIEGMNTADGVEMCDRCCLYPGDLAAALALAAHVPGGRVFFLVEGAPANDPPMAYTGEGSVPADVYIESGTDPWIVGPDGWPVEWYREDPRSGGVEFRCLPYRVAA